MVEYGAFSHKIDYVTNFKEILHYHYRFKSYDNFAEWVDFAYWWTFSGERSESAACAAGLLRMFCTEYLHGTLRHMHMNYIVYVPLYTLVHV